MPRAVANSGQPRAQPLNLRIELLVGVLVGVLREIAGLGEVTEDAPERYFVDPFEEELLQVRVPAFQAQTARAQKVGKGVSVPAGACEDGYAPVVVRFAIPMQGDAIGTDVNLDDKPTGLVPATRAGMLRHAVEVGSDVVTGSLAPAACAG